MNPTLCSGSDAPRVQIISHSDAGELVCASAARISTTQGSALTVFERSKEKENNGTLIEKVVASGHRSVVEHAVFTVAFDNVSVCTEEFVIEFRLASYTVQSRRYVDFSDIGFYTPDMPQACEGPYKSHMTALFETYARLLDMGIPKEDARFVLPYCFRSNFYCTMNARELMHMMATMLWGRGREIPELVALGTSLKQQLEAFFPNRIPCGHSMKTITAICAIACPKPFLPWQSLLLLLHGACCVRLRRRQMKPCAVLPCRTVP